MNVFVAGATGAVGRPCTRILILRGHRVFAMTRDPDRQRDLWEAGAIPVVQDVMDAEGLRLALLATRPDAVMHQLTDLSKIRDPSRLEEALRSNARLRKEGTANLVAAALSAGVERLVAQSIAWAYATIGEPHLEEAPLDTGAPGLRGVTVDGIATLERLVLAATGISGCILRYGQLYGPGTGSEDGKGKSMPLHVDAAAWAAVLALEEQAVGAYNIAERNEHINTEKARRELGWHDQLRA